MPFKGVYFHHYSELNVMTTLRHISTVTIYYRHY